MRTLKNMVVGLSGLALLTGCLAYKNEQGQVSERAAEKPNIIYILADDQGWSDVGFNGAEFYETPNIDRLAREGMVFREAYSSGPNCAPTRASLISGTYPPRHLIYQPGGGAKGDPRLMKLAVPLLDKRIKQYGLTVTEPAFEIRTELAPEFTGIAEMLKGAGYTTAHFGKWHLGPDAQGFEISSPDGIVDPTTDEARFGFYQDPDIARRITDASVNFIKANRDKPFFLYVAHFDVHTPLVADEAVVSKYEKKLAAWTGEPKSYNPTYAAMNDAVDTSVGRILGVVNSLGLSENTLIIYTSDNGGVGRISINAPLRAGKGSLYEGGIRVPFAARWVGTVKAGTETRVPINSVDMMPTFAALTGAELPDNQAVDGVSFVSVLEGGEMPDRPIFWHYPLYLDGQDRTNYIPLPGGKAGQGDGWRAMPASAIRWGEWKLIEYFEDGRYELYHIASDIGETQDVAKQFPDIARRLHARLRLWRQETDAVVPVPGGNYAPL